MRFGLGITLPLLLLLFVLPSSTLARRPQPLEGTRWKVKLTPDPDAHKAGERDFDDVLVFKGGKFSATECEKYGFKPVDYEEDTRGISVARFTAEPVSEKEGKAKWTGTVTASEMSGQMQWTKKDGTVLNYTFIGERLQK